MPSHKKNEHGRTIKEETVSSEEEEDKELELVDCNDGSCLTGLYSY